MGVKTWDIGGNEDADDEFDINIITPRTPEKPKKPQSLPFGQGPELQIIPVSQDQPPKSPNPHDVETWETWLPNHQP